MAGPDNNKWSPGRGPYVRRTLSGKKFYIANPDGQWDLQDIAFHLAGINRYSGGSEFSVAQHCVVAARMADKYYPDNALLPARMLIHDAAEAVYGDMSSPLKSLCPDYARLLTMADASIERFFDLTFMDDPLVKEIDDRMWLTERVPLYAHLDPEEIAEDTAWCRHAPFPLPDESFEPWSREEAEAEWLLSCRRLLPWVWK